MDSDRVFEGEKRDAEFELHLFLKYELRSKRKVQFQEGWDQRLTLLLIILAFW